MFDNLLTSCIHRQKKRIIDLKIKSLHKIFNYIDMKDLLNVADSNSHLKRAAECVFVEKYDNEKLWLYQVRERSKNKLCEKSSKPSSPTKITLQMLRLFGHLISNLEISEDMPFDKLSELQRRTYRHIFRYVDTYCSSYLTELTLVMVPSDALEELKKSFIRLKTITVFGCHY